MRNDIETEIRHTFSRFLTQIPKKFRQVFRQYGSTETKMGTVGVFVHDRWFNGINFNV